jgi:large subunit ribosomal protein L3
MGDERVTVQNLRVVSVDLENGLLLVEGAVPGAKNSMVVVSDAKKQ